MFLKKEKRWFVFYCMSRSEKKAQQTLSEDGWEVYLPLRNEIHIWSDRKKNVTVPLFRGYIFANCKTHEVYQLLTNRYIVAPVKIGNEFAYLRQREVDLIRKIEEHGYIVSAEPKKINIGDSVEITVGALKGYKGKCIVESNKNYVLIDIESIDYQLKVKVLKRELKILK